MLLFVGRLGSTFSVVLAIPITITGAVLIFGLLGFTFNTVTLLAITVAVGLVVDDSIVIAENVERYRAMGANLKEAVFKGAGEVAVAVLTATLSLLAVFVPIAFLPGVIGQFFSQFGLSLAATIFVSYLEAMFFLTVRLAYLPNPLPPTWRAIGPALRALGPDARWAARQWRRARTYVAAGALAALAGAAVAQGWTSALPAGLGRGGLAGDRAGRRGGRRRPRPGARGAAAARPGGAAVRGPVGRASSWARRSGPGTRPPTRACAGCASATPARSAGCSTARPRRSSSPRCWSPASASSSR